MPAGHGPFAVWNRTGNQAVALLLRSPLHPLVDRGLLLITVTGRRTGREHTLPVGYRLDGDRVTIPVGWPERKVWWRNLRGGAPVRLDLRGARRAGHGVARESADGRVSVEVTLEPLSPAAARSS